MSNEVKEIDAKETQLYCYRHPERETLLRCNRCERPICTKCAIATPTGYRCPECIHSQQKIFDTTQTSDYIIAAIIAAVLSFVASWIASFLGFFTLFIAPIAGVIIAEAVRWGTRRRRSKTLFRVTTIAAALGSLPLLLIKLLLLILILANDSGALISNFFPLLWQGVFTIMVSSSVYYRMAGIRTGSRY